mgnify:CR=1 FL=1
MNIQIGSIVKALAGRDRYSYYVAVELHDGFVKIANGKERKLEKPKLKNTKHISPTHKVIDMNELTNKKLRRILMEFQTQNSEPQAL